MSAHPGKPLAWCENGWTVYAPAVIGGKRWLVPAKVEKAAGHHAFVVNSRYGLQRWYEVCDLLEYVKDPDPPRGGGEPAPEPRRAAA